MVMRLLQLCGIRVRWSWFTDNRSLRTMARLQKLGTGYIQGNRPQNGKRGGKAGVWAINCEHYPASAISLSNRARPAPEQPEIGCKLTLPNTLNRILAVGVFATGIASPDSRRRKAPRGGPLGPKRLDSLATAARPMRTAKQVRE